MPISRRVRIILLLVVVVAVVAVVAITLRRKAAAAGETTAPGLQAGGGTTETTDPGTTTQATTSAPAATTSAPQPDYCPVYGLCTPNNLGAVEQHLVTPTEGLANDINQILWKMDAEVVSSTGTRKISPGEMFYLGWEGVLPPSRGRVDQITQALGPIILKHRPDLKGKSAFQFFGSPDDKTSQLYFFDLSKEVSSIGDVVMYPMKKMEMGTYQVDMFMPRQWFDEGQCPTPESACSNHVTAQPQ